MRVRAASSRLLLTIVLSSTAVVAASSQLARAASPALPSRPNIVFILTDDQRWDELQYMPNVQDLLQNDGITFTNGFVSNPLCCPARATILTGEYSGHNGVWSNQSKASAGGRHSTTTARRTTRSRRGCTTPATTPASSAST